ncbi:hypothetical protein DSO57_1035020 [Entomophthora muscae]|uniref:Uncharacterized protein n=1 Tax=Entomophthora muscae TaxID=34485 RepID=A0ACC2UKK2_9FUNG|nr:hypothetical protein DSO57_1035020 [Entomophthora muscae]
MVPQEFPDRDSGDQTSGSFPGFLLLPLRWAPALSSGINGKLIALIMACGVQQQIIGEFFIGCTRWVPLQSDFERR